MMFKELEGKKRLLMEAELVPIQGDRFQPTGFPDIGAGTYQLPNGTRMLLVESAQSVANRLEEAILGPDNELMDELNGLSYVRAQLSGASDTTTNSLIEAHRINSPYIITNKDFQERFVEAAEYEANKPIDWRKVAGALFRYDVNSLLHGVFLANLKKGKIKIKVPRAISGFIEARNAREVVSGGVKFNHIDPTGTLRAKEYDDEDVYGNVLYQREEYAAEEITAYFNLDLGLIKSYHLGNDARDLLIALALFKIRTFLEKGTRLRTACDLKLNDKLRATEPQAFQIPEKDKLLEKLKEKINACKPLFSDPPVTEINCETVLKEKKEQNQ